MRSEFLPGVAKGPGLRNECPLRGEESFRDGGGGDLVDEKDGISVSECCIIDRYSTSRQTCIRKEYRIVGEICSRVRPCVAFVSSTMVWRRV